MDTVRRHPSTNVPRPDSRRTAVPVNFSRPGRDPVGVAPGLPPSNRPASQTARPTTPPAQRPTGPRTPFSGAPWAATARAEGQTGRPPSRRGSVDSTSGSRRSSMSAPDFATGPARRPAGGVPIGPAMTPQRLRPLVTTPATSTSMTGVSISGPTNARPINAPTAPGPSGRPTRTSSGDLNAMERGSRPSSPRPSSPTMPGTYPPSPTASADHANWRAEGQQPSQGVGWRGAAAAATLTGGALYAFGVPIAGAVNAAKNIK